MDIPFHSGFDSTRWAFVMTLEPQHFGPAYDGDTSRLNIQAMLKRPAYSENQAQGLYPVLLELHGKLCRANSFEVGATLLPLMDLPIILKSPERPQLVNLSFVFSPHYLQLLEEHRASQQGHDMLLQVQMWGMAAMVRPRTATTEIPNNFPNLSSEVIYFDRMQTEGAGQLIRIERSAWVDRILPGLGYRRSVIIELPLIRTPTIPEVYQKAAEALDLAKQAFDQADYRGAVRYTRDVLEHLGKISSDGSGKISSFCKEYLTPSLGETKSNAIDRSLNAIREIVNASSHADPQNPFMVDHATAAYVIETLALDLRYISALLG